MTETFQLPPASEEAHRAIAQKAASVLAGMVDGNGLKAAQVRLAKQDVQINLIPAAVKVTLKPDIAKTQQRGEAPQGTVVGSEAEVLQQAMALGQQALEDTGLQQEIQMALKQMPGGGFGIPQPIAFAVKTAGKVFSVVGPCATCGGTAAITCSICRGEGKTPCQTCRGEGFTQCRICFGTGLMQDSSGNRVSCTLCQHTGRIVCFTCNGLRQLGCPSCGGRGSMGCTVCGSSGHMTDIYRVTYKAVCEFDIDWRNVELLIRQAMAKVGNHQTVAAKGHAEIYWQPPFVNEEDGSLMIPCTAVLPTANVEFSVEGKVYPAVVVGLQGRIVQMDPALDPIVKPGIAALMKLSKKRVAAQALIDTACKYRLVRQVLGGLARRSKKAVYQTLVSEYPVVLSDKYARATISYAEKALLAISAVPRYRGLAAGTVFAGLLSAGYYMGHVRSSILAHVAQGNVAGLLDIIVWLLGYVATVLVIKFMTASAFKKMLPQTVQSDKGRLPSAGMQGLAALPVTGLVWFIVAASAAEKPEWILYILK